MAYFVWREVSEVVFTARRNASAIYAMGGMGLCPSVTNRSSAKIVKCRMVLIVPYNTGILVF